MTDPFSVVAGVVGIVGVALSNTRQVYDFIAGIKGAPETVTTLSGDLYSLANILQQLADLTEDPSQALFIVPLKGSLERCIAALKQLDLSIKPYVEGLQNGKSKWRRFAWNFKEKEVAALQVRLGSCRENLQLAILLGVMTQQASGSKDIRASFQKLQQTAAVGDHWSVAGSAVPSSEAPGSDYGYALKRFLLEHESELGSQLGDDPIPEETIDEPAASPSGGGFLDEREKNLNVGHELESDELYRQHKGLRKVDEDSFIRLTVHGVRARLGDEKVDFFLRTMGETEEALRAMANLTVLPETRSIFVQSHVIFLWNSVARRIVRIDKDRAALASRLEDDFLLPAEWTDRLELLQKKLANIRTDLM